MSLKNNIGRRGGGGQGPFPSHIQKDTLTLSWAIIQSQPCSPPGAPDREAIVAVLDDVTLIGEIPFLVVSYKAAVSQKMEKTASRIERQGDEGE